MHSFLKAAMAKSKKAMKRLTKQEKERVNDVSARRAAWAVDDDHPDPVEAFMHKSIE